MSLKSDKISLVILIFLLLFAASGLVSIGLSLLIGIAYALIIGNPFRSYTQPASALILKISVVLLGFSINFAEIVKTTQSNLLITIATIVLALVLGIALGKILRINNKLSFLVASGTAICGGSAIAAVAPAINAKSSQIIISVSVVFLLNAVGLFIFPEIGQWLGLSQKDFGLWAALAIHDTSSVVGAAAAYGEESLNVATTTKLARALWIIPLVILSSSLFNNGTKKFTLPLFIVFFVLASLITSNVNLPNFVSEYSIKIAKTGMAISLFLIGAGLSKSIFSEIKWSALWLGIILWLIISAFSLCYIMYF